MFWKLCLTVALFMAAPSACVTLQSPAPLAAAYPGWFSADDHALTWADGEVMPLDDGRIFKSFADKLLSADLDDQLSLPYPAGSSFPLPKTDQDPGRLRFMPFFKKMYGATEQDVREKLVTVRWLPNSADVPLLVTTVNGVNKSLEAISAEIEELSPETKACALRPAGTFCWRPIAGTDRLSPHSFGIALDLDVEWSQYWRWDLDGDKKKMEYANRIPLEIVEIFERHGFIWGGKWYHYDTMHFEYRPELLGKRLERLPKGAAQ